MKNLNLLFIALIFGVCLMSSCKKDRNQLMPSDITGVWNVERGEAFVTNDEDIQDTYDVKTSGTITLNADGTGNDDFILTINGNAETLKESYTWELNGAVLTLRTTHDEYLWNVEKDKGGFNLVRSEGMSGRPDLTIELTFFLRD